MNQWPRPTTASMLRPHRRCAAAGALVAALLLAAPALHAASKSASPADRELLNARLRAEALLQATDATRRLCTVEAASRARSSAALGYSVAQTAPPPLQNPRGSEAPGARAPSSPGKGYPDFSNMEWRWRGDSWPATGAASPPSGGVTAKPPPTSIPTPVLSPPPDIGPPGRS